MPSTAPSERLRAPLASTAAAAPGDRWLERGWEAAWRGPGDGEEPPAHWIPATVPGTAAGALARAGIPLEGRDLDQEDWWFRLTFIAPPPAAGERVLLCLDGLATIAEVRLNGQLVLQSSSMWQRHVVDVSGVLQRENRLELHCRPLSAAPPAPRRPRRRWRTRLVADAELRWRRTMLLGRAPGLGAVPPAVGPWRGIRLVRPGPLSAEAVRVRASVDGADGRLAVAVSLAARRGTTVRAAHVEARGPTGVHAQALRLGGPPGAPTAEGILTLPDVARWWPHTHGDPALYDVRVHLVTDGEPLALDAGRVGFRTLAAGPEPGHRIDADGLDLHLNGVRVFVRGAVWTPVDPVSLNPEPAALRHTLTAARDAGLNLLRVVGTMAYESPAFHDLCDELGILVWQDLMFANLDYPFGDADFAAQAADELEGVLEQLAGRPSFAVLCGNSEVEQQAAMMGLDGELLGRGPFFGETVPARLTASGSDALHVPSAPCGGVRPFVPDRGVANWFGVGGYERPLEDTRRAGVRFASECLAFANVPDADVLEAFGPHGGAPRDAGTAWDFADTRDAYLPGRYGADPAALRREDPQRYLELSRALTGELMAEVFGEWRRAGSPCGGGIVLWWRDVVPGSGWGLLDVDGRPKAAYHLLRRALAPVAVWTVDEGLGGLRIHVANDRPLPLRARLRVALHRDGEQRVDAGEELIHVSPHRTVEHDAEALLGHFADIVHHYRFGPAAHDLVVVRLEAEDGTLLSQSCRTLGPPRLGPEDAGALGLWARAAPAAPGRAVLRLGTRRLVRGLRVDVPGFVPADDAFDLAPGETRSLTLVRAYGSGTDRPGGSVGALNLRGRLRIATDDAAEGEPPA